MIIPTEFGNPSTTVVVYTEREFMLRHYEAADEDAESKAEICVLMIGEEGNPLYENGFAYGIHRHTRVVPITYPYPAAFAAFLLEEMKNGLRAGVAEFDLMEAIYRTRRFYAHERYAQNVRDRGTIWMPGEADDIAG